MFDNVLLKHTLRNYALTNKTNKNTSFIYFSKKTVEHHLYFLTLYVLCLYTYTGS